MGFSEFFDQIIFTIRGQDIRLSQLVLVALSVLALAVLGYLLRTRWIDRWLDREDMQESSPKAIRLNTIIVLGLLSVLIVVLGLGIDFPMREEGVLSRIKLSTLIQALLIYFVARVVDLLLSAILARRYQQRRQQEIDEGIYHYPGRRGSGVKVSRIVQPIVYILALSFIIQEFNVDATIPVPWTKDPANDPTINTILSAILILLFTRLATWVITEIILHPYYKSKSINVGSQFAINRLLTYFLLVVAILAVLQYVGLNLTVIWGGAAALLVGVGLGLQQTFNDLISGIILLFERTVEVGDVVEVGSLIGTVKEIGVRTSLIESRDNISVIVPNSKLVGDNVVNWSHFDMKARFQVSVGVAYGSDTALVKEILLKVASQHKKVLKYPSVFVRFTGFGDSSLDFELHFWSRELERIEDVKSDLRFGIDQQFREANVEIPFPQRDVWMRKG